ncbi:glycosyltransferase [Dyadobacter sp. NIV53]|uniref:glycosyltransferase n=1 Tax=Dyadobacter sp. NIV53 TaxID=2861765 RepID=UPI001C880CDE|nr:glycosyltransferase [Dyadobacter sp. NIV53]
MPDYFFKYKNLTKIIFVHFSLDHLFSGLLKSYRIDRWAKKLKQYDFILAISKRGYSQLKPFCNTDQLRLIYNPTFEKEIIPLSLQEYQLPDGVINGEYIISVGRLDENQKDFTSLIKAIKIANANYNQSYKLLIVGAGRDKEYLEKLVIDNSLQKFVFFIGNQRNPYPYIANSSLLVLSTKFEGFGNVLLEAIILGKLAISSDCLTGPSEILNHEKLLVPVGNSRLLAGSDPCFTLN